MIRKLPAWVWFGGGLLTLSAGMVNSVALLSYANQAVTHVTGSITLSSAALAQENWNGALSFGGMGFFPGCRTAGHGNRSRFR